MPASSTLEGLLCEFGAVLAELEGEVGVVQSEDLDGQKRRIDGTVDGHCRDWDTGRHLHCRQ